MTDTPTPDCFNCATGWADGPLCRQHANDEIERLKSALAGRTQSCSQCDASAAEIERLQAKVDEMEGAMRILAKHVPNWRTYR